MTKEEFEQQLKHEVVYWQNKLTHMNLKKILLPKEVFPNLKTNPFLDYDERFFNIRILSNLMGLKSFIEKNNNLTANQIALFLISEYKYVTLNKLLNYNPYLIDALISGIHQPIDIAISFAEYSKSKERLKKILM